MRWPAPGVDAWGVSVFSVWGEIGVYEYVYEYGESHILVHVLVLSNLFEDHQGSQLPNLNAERGCIVKEGAVIG